jgi:HK97 gp10 family phage protein
MAVVGIPEMRRRVTSIPAMVVTYGQDAMEKGAQEIVDMMKRLVPVDDGDLRDSIGWTWGDAPKGAVALLKSAPIRGNLRVTIYAGNQRAFYAAWVEFGTQKKPAQPYFFPSYRALKTRTKRRLTTAVRKGLKFVGPVMVEADT